MGSGFLRHCRARYVGVGLERTNDSAEQIGIGARRGVGKADAGGAFHDACSDLEQRQTPRATPKLFRRFHFCGYCLALTEPLVVNEGETDPVYLCEAVKSRTKFHPELGAPEKDDFKNAVRYFNYSGLAHEVMDLGGGTGDLKSTPLDYLRSLKPSEVPISHLRTIQGSIRSSSSSTKTKGWDEGLAVVASTVTKNFGLAIEIISTADSSV